MEVVVGRVAKAHGIHGELAVDVRTDSPDQRFAIGYVLTARTRTTGTRQLTVAAARAHSAGASHAGGRGRLLVRFEEVRGRGDAEQLRGAVLHADTDDLPPITDPDEFYDHDLEGLAAELVDGTAAGTVREVLHSPGGELLALDYQGREVLVPFVRALVPTVDVAGGRVVLDPPHGLLDA